MEAERNAPLLDTGAKIYIFVTDRYKMLHKLILLGNIKCVVRCKRSARSSRSFLYKLITQWLEYTRMTCVLYSIKTIRGYKYLSYENALSCITTAFDLYFSRLNFRERKIKSIFCKLRIFCNSQSSSCFWLIFVCS
jgi:hypothetical protein